MPINGFTVGRDVTLTVIDGSGSPLSLGLITNFTSKQETSEQDVLGIDGIVRPVKFYKGWSGSFDVERQDSTVDDYFAGLEDSYYSGNSEKPSTITETITEVDGSISQYKYQGVLLKLDDAGPKSGDKTVAQKISFRCSRRIKM